MTTWLVTGAQGFLGRFVVACIQSTDPGSRIVGLGRSPELRTFSHPVTTPAGPQPAPVPTDLPASQTYSYHSIDLTATDVLQPILEQYRPDVIIHLASGLRGDALPKLLRSNMEATASLFRAIGFVSQFTPRVVFASTGGVYGRLNASDLPVSESHCPQPAEDYGVTKLAAEHLARNAASRLGVRLVIGRIFNLLGPAQDERHVAGQIALQLARLQRCTDPRGLALGPLCATRDFLDVRDAAAALVLLAKSPDAPEIVNVASGRECSIEQLLQTFLKRANMNVSVQSDRGAALDVPRHVGDVTRLASLGFNQNYSLESSVNSIWSYYQRLWGT